MSVVPSCRETACAYRHSTTSHIDAELIEMAGEGTPEPGVTTTTPTGQAFAAAQPVLRWNVSAATTGDVLAHFSPDGGTTWFEALTVGDEVT